MDHTRSLNAVEKDKLLSLPQYVRPSRPSGSQHWLSSVDPTWRRKGFESTVIKYVKTQNMWPCIAIHFVRVALKALQAPAHCCRHQYITAGTSTLLQALQAPALHCRHYKHQHITAGTTSTSSSLQALQAPAYHCRHCKHQHITAGTASTSTLLQHACIAFPP